jgi:hypothetical protein
MQFLRVTHNAWGQSTVAGISWDLLPWFVGAAIAFIVLHALWMAVRGFRQGTSTGV